MGYLLKLAEAAEPPAVRTVEDELRRMVPLVIDRMGFPFTAQDRLEALQTALEHPEEGLAWWRGQAERLGVK